MELAEHILGEYFSGDGKTITLQKEHKAGVIDVARRLGAGYASEDLDSLAGMVRAHAVLHGGEVAAYDLYPSMAVTLDEGVLHTHVLSFEEGVSRLALYASLDYLAAGDISARFTVRIHDPQETLFRRVCAQLRYADYLDAPAIRHRRRIDLVPLAHE